MNKDDIVPQRVVNFYRSRLLESVTKSGFFLCALPSAPPAPVIDLATRIKDLIEQTEYGRSDDLPDCSRELGEALELLRRTRDWILGNCEAVRHDDLDCPEDDTCSCPNIQELNDLARILSHSFHTPDPKGDTK